MEIPLSAGAAAAGGPLACKSLTLAINSSMLNSSSGFSSFFSSFLD
jgi:hypothetical protein